MPPRRNVIHRSDAIEAVEALSRTCAESVASGPIRLAEASAPPPWVPARYGRRGDNRRGHPARPQAGVGHRRCPWHRPGHRRGVGISRGRRCHLRPAGTRDGRRRGVGGSARGADAHGRSRRARRGGGRRLRGQDPGPVGRVGHPGQQRRWWVLRTRARREPQGSCSADRGELHAGGRRERALHTDDVGRLDDRERHLDRGAPRRDRGSASTPR